MAKKISLAKINDVIPSGMKVRLKDGEYRVNFVNGTEATAYYTNDAHDAVNTARAMWARRLKTNPKRKKSTRKRSPRDKKGRVWGTRAEANAANARIKAAYGEVPMRTRKNPRSSSLRDAVIEQLGGGEEAEDSLKDVANHGAGGGFPGFTYTRDTVKFFDANEDAIMSLADEMADGLGEKNVWTMIGGFSQAPSADIDSLKNSLAWFALESVAQGDA